MASGRFRVVWLALALGPAALAECAPVSQVPSPPPEAPPAAASGAVESGLVGAWEVKSSTPPPRNLIEIAPPAQVGCSIAVTRWRGTISLRPEEPVFATVVASGSLDVPASGAGSALARVGEGGLLLSAWAQRVKLYLARPRAVAGILYPKAMAELPWKGAGRAGALTVAFDTKKLLVSSDELREDLPCAEFSALPAGYRDRDAIPVDGQGEEIAIVEEAPLAPVPGAPPVARFRRGAGGPVRAFTRTGKERLILVEQPDYLMAGWVPQSSLGENHAGHGMPGRIGVAYGTMETGKEGSIRCQHDVPVYGEQAGLTARLGVLARGTWFKKAPPSREASEGMVAISLPGTQWLVLGADALLVVAASDLTDCGS